MKSIITILSLILVLTFTLPACAETISNPVPIKEAFSTYYSTSKVLVENDAYILISVGYAEISKGNNVTSEDLKVTASPYKYVIVLGMQNDLPVMCLYIPVNEDGSLPQGGIVGDPNTTSTVLISPALMFQNMTPTAP